MGSGSTTTRRRRLPYTLLFACRRGRSNGLLALAQCAQSRLQVESTRHFFPLGPAVGTFGREVLSYVVTLYLNEVEIYSPGFLAQDKQDFENKKERDKFSNKKIENLNGGRFDVRVIVLKRSARSSTSTNIVHISNCVAGSSHLLLLFLVLQGKLLAQIRIVDVVKQSLVAQRSVHHFEANRVTAPIISKALSGWNSYKAFRSSSLSGILRKGMARPASL